MKPWTPASVTKVMTLLLAFEAIEAGQMTQLTDIVTVSEHAASMGGSQCFFEAGEEQTVEDMIKCIIIASGNDAAVAMAEFTLQEARKPLFREMNDRAKELGMVAYTVLSMPVDWMQMDMRHRQETSAIMSRQLIDETS